MVVMRRMSEMDIKRVSIISAHKLSLQDPEIQKRTEALAPPDRFHLTHLIFLFFGLGGILPYSFFMVSQNYWLYKFRDTTKDVIDLNNKTILQKNFVSITSITHSVAALFTILISSRYGHKINIRWRMIFPLVNLFAMFAVYTAFTKIDTDEWQVQFFIATLLVSSFVTIGTSSFHVTEMALVSKFPPAYLKTHVYATGAAALFGAALQIACLSTGWKSSNMGLLYYACGTFVLGVTVLCSIFCKYVPRFMYYLGDTEADTTRPVLPLAKMLETAKLIWPYLTVTVVDMLTMGMAYPNITVLIVSEYYNQGSVFYDTYFSPVITFLLPDVIGLIGKYFGRPVLTHKTAKWYILANLTRVCTILPLFLFCNAQPRHHLPVWFPHDWQYILILSVAVLTSHWFTTSTFMSMPNLLPEGKAEDGYLVLISMVGVLSLASSTLSSVWVNIL